MPPLLLCAVVLAASPLPAPLVEAIRAGEKQSHPLTIARAQAELRAAQVEGNLGGLLPTFGARVNYTRNQYNVAFDLVVSQGVPPQRIVISPFNQVNGALILNVPLVNPAAFGQYDASKAVRDAAREGVELSRRDVQSLVAQVYYRVVAAQGVVEAAKRAVATAQENRRVVSLRLGEGTTNRLALDKAKVDEAQAQTALVNAGRNLALAKRQLSTLTGLPEVGTLPEPPEPAGPEEREDELVEQAKTRRPDIAQAQANLHSAELVHRTAWLATLPTLNSNVQENFTNAVSFSGRQRFWTANFTLQFNLSPLETRAALRQAEAGITIARQNLAALVEQVRDGVHAAFLDVEANQARVAQARLAAAAAKEQLELAQLRLKEGVALPLEVSQAQADAFNAEAALAQASADLAYSLLALRHAAGELLVE